MRKLIFSCLFAALCVLGLFSCTTKSEFTPYISFSSFLRNPVLSGDTIIGCQDTIQIAEDSQLKAFVLDTIGLGDTAVFVVGFGSRGNDLISATIETDTMAMSFRCSLNDVIRGVLRPSSSEKDMRFDFVSGYNFVSFPVFYVPKKMGAHKMVFTVNSDSKFSPVSYTIIQYVAAKED